MSERDFDIRAIGCILDAIRDGRSADFEISIHEGRVVNLCTTVQGVSVRTDIGAFYHHQAVAKAGNTLSYNDILERFKDIKPDEKPKRRGRGGDKRRW